MTKDSDIQSLFKRAGRNLSAIDQIADHLYKSRLPLEHALRAYKEYLVDKPDSANAVFNYAYYLSKDGQFETAVDMYQRALKLGIDTPEEVHLNIANICMDHLKNSERAKAHLQQALKLNPAYASAYYNLGNLSETEGNRAEACRCFEQCLKLDPANESALARLADAHIFVTEEDPLLASLIVVARKSRNSDVHFALGRAYEKLALFELAWQHFSTANQLDRPTLPSYRQAVTEAVFHRIRSQCSYQWLSRFAGLSDETVFICGMFRSGSTLLEQILAAHPRFVAGGESEFFPRLVAKEFGNYPEGLESLTTEKAHSWKAQHTAQSRKLFGDAVRITDKRPDNFLHIGLIKAVLPSAKFVVTERDWRDVATSVYSTRLGPGQSYATSLVDIRHYIGLQRELVDHWQSLLGPDLIRVRYEDIVSEPRDTITRVLECLGEDWDERCLSFNTLKNAVQTASVWQVREPLHTNSVGRWRNYEQHFENAFNG